MGRVRMTQGVRAHTTINPGCLRGEADSIPDALGGERTVGAPAVLLSWEQVRSRAHPAVVLAQRDEQRRTERDFAAVAAFATLDADHHALAIDVRDLELEEFAPAQARAVERHQHRPVVEILRA